MNGKIIWGRLNGTISRTVSARDTNETKMGTTICVPCGLFYRGAQLGLRYWHWKRPYPVIYIYVPSKKLQNFSQLFPLWRPCLHNTAALPCTRHCVRLAIPANLQPVVVVVIVWRRRNRRGCGGVWWERIVLVEVIRRPWKKKRGGEAGERKTIISVHRPPEKHAVGKSAAVYKCVWFLPKWCAPKVVNVTR